MNEQTHRHVDPFGAVSYWEGRRSGKSGPGHDVTGPGGVARSWKNEDDAAFFAARLAAAIKRDEDRESGK